MKTVLFHLSHKKLKWIRPGRSQGKMRVVWLCSHFMIDEVAEHLNRRQYRAKIKYIHLVHVEEDMLTRRRTGIYVCDRKVKVYQVYPMDSASVRYILNVLCELGGM